MKKIAIMQPYLFPYIGYWQLVDSVDEFVVLDDVQYINRGWINRNRILMNNREHLFTFSLKNDSRLKMIYERFFSPEFEHEKQKFLRSLQFSYSKSPYFQAGYSLIEQCLDFSGQNIAREIGRSIKGICNYLGITTEIRYSTEINCNKNLKGQDHILEINKALESQIYVNLAGGINLYSKEVFLQNNIELYFIKCKEIFYNQFNDSFVPNLSIIDIVMFNSKAEIREMLKRYELV
jgi:hypothetical protein